MAAPNKNYTLKKSHLLHFLLFVTSKIFDSTKSIFFFLIYVFMLQPTLLSCGLCCPGQLYHSPASPSPLPNYMPLFLSVYFETQAEITQLPTHVVG
jgi:hypothetical protein